MSARDVQRHIRRLVGGRDGFAPLARLDPVGPRPGERSGTGRPAGGAEVSAEGDIEEADYAAREYWPVQEVTSSDGLFVWEVAPVRSILLTTGERLRFAEPVEATPEP